MYSRWMTTEVQDFYSTKYIGSALAKDAALFINIVVLDLL